MSWFRKARPVLLIVGLGLAIGSLLGSRALTNGHSEANAQPSGGPRAPGGPVVLGTVDTDPPPVAYGLPPVLQTGRVSKVFVKDGDEVKADQELYAFDATIQQQDVKRAEMAVAYANTQVKAAEELAKRHAGDVRLADKAVKAAERKVNLTDQQYKLVEQGLERYYKGEKIPESEWPERKKGEATLYKASVDYDTAVNELELAKAKRDELKTADPQVKVKEAEAGVKQAEAELDKARAAVDLCTVRAKTAGTVERVTISPGTTLGIGTRDPALWLIPAGPRVVRAEVEAEFAHRVGADLKGKTVTISDHSDPKLTYTGTVGRIANTFLLKRSGADNLLGNDTRVIEVVVEVKDPAPDKKPPLRVGQRVRVNLGQ
jgi:multidrug resistance efflux pump